MITRKFFGAAPYGQSLGQALSICAIVLSMSAGAQINRSQPPASTGGQGGRTPAPSGGGASRSDTGRTPRDSAPSASPRTDRGRTPDTVSQSPAPADARGSAKALDRYNRTHESSDAKNSSSSSARVHYIPGSPYGYFPGYDPYGNSPYYFPYPNPEPFPYPTPRDRSVVVARYDSPYYYCQDLSGGQYVDGTAVTISRPKRLYTPTPVYKDNELSEWRDLGSDDYLGGRNAESTDYRVREQQSADAALDAAVADIQQSWLKADVEPLARHLRKETPVAVILQGKYVYSLEAGDLLEVTRRAYDSSPGLPFVFDHIHRRADGVYTLTGRHLYTDTRGTKRTVFFSYVLSKVQSDYVLIQLASASDRE